MSTVRVNDKIRKEVMPILDDLGLSLGEAINIYLHQIKINDGIPFAITRKWGIELNDGKGSYICENGNLHDYSKVDLEKISKDTDGKIYNNVEELKKAMEDDE